ncbi:47_t:CDS:1, partial [Racocetra fulgida]
HYQDGFYENCKSVDKEKLEALLLPNQQKKNKNANECYARNLVYSKKLLELLFFRQLSDDYNNFKLKY